MYELLLNRQSLLITYSFFYAMGHLYRNENVLALSLCDP